MSRHSRHLIFRHIVMLLAVPLVLTSTGYALFSQELSVNTTTSFPTYTTSNNMAFTYTTTLGSAGQKTVFDITGTVTNQGTNSVSSWVVMFDMPSDYSNFSCGGTVSCSTNGVAATINNGSGNGTIAAGNSVNFTVSFRSSLTSYNLQNMSVAGTAPAQYQPMTGLTVSISHGSSTKSKGTYYWPYTFTVTNNSGNAIQGWHIISQWNNGTTNTVSSMSTTVNYVESPTQLTILSTSGLANGSSIQFNASLTSKSSNWTLTGAYVEGAL